jgi:type IV secretion system protein VirB1
MTVTLATLMITCAPLVHPTTLRALIAVESAGNPYAVSVNYPRALASAGASPPPFAQPHSARAALGLTRILLAHGFGTSVGLAQVNVEYVAGRNLRIADLFNPCINLAVAQRVLLDCASIQPRGTALKAEERLSRTLRCYNAGASTTDPDNHYAAAVMRAAVGHLDHGSRPALGPT